MICEARCHPGPLVVLIKSGAMTLYSGDDPTCTGRIYTAGLAFIDSGQGHVHIARNESSAQNLELWAVYFDVPPGGLFESTHQRRRTVNSNSGETVERADGAKTEEGDSAESFWCYLAARPVSRMC